ncbi:Fumarylacetoacetate hydrolase domain-containing protein 2 [Penicillium subrubescens]|uniref:Fumarylacetoacetate hydrolase domain-containing protein 2 n=1 Tax=Penicillium subrubescens TaxID=1316194 RepID=A0A1Q5U0P3_9EURO|nr:Fumarylacetoacetate hydrolase domain-containing protein 2 [Penicillium subrubescens]
MLEFRYLVHFENDNGDQFFANGDSPDPVIGGQIAAYRSFDDLREGKGAVNTAIAKLKVPANPPVWTKPAAALASPNEEIVMNRFCASNLPDWELPEQSGGQFFYAKAFDKFAPLGPVLVHPSLWHEVKKIARLVTRINGKVKQNCHLDTDMICEPARVLSWMSQGTPAGVGAFQSPREFLKDNDVVEVEVTGLGTLRNVIRFGEGQDSMR